MMQRRGPLTGLAEGSHVLRHRGACQPGPTRLHARVIALGWVVGWLLLAACRPLALPTSAPSPEASVTLRPPGMTPAPTPRPAAPAPDASTAALRDALPASGPPFEETATCPWGGTRCGYVVVPERHGQPGGPTLRLAVAVFRSRPADSDADAVVFLNGGPGGKMQPSLAAAVASTFGADHDVIVFDQRGAGLSQPSLACPEVDQQVLRDAAQEVSNVEADAHYVAAALACRDRLIGQGAHLAVYSTAESAADVNDIRLALGYRQLDLVGVSYGTYLAQAVMGAFPQAVRSAILDSVLPSETTALGLHQLGSFDHVLNEAFARCAADAACHQAYPDLKQNYLDLVAHLDTQPLTVRVDPSGTLRVDGRRFGEAVIQQLYAGLGETPALIAAARRGHDDVVARWLAPTVQPGGAEDLGMHLSISCHDGVAGGPPEALAQAAPAVLPGLREALAARALTFTSICAQWPPAPADPASHAPVVSDVPTLILVGQFDPVNPPEFGQLVTRRLSRSVYVELPGQGHAAGLAQACGRAIALRFVATPASKPDTSCTSSLHLTFRLP